MTRETHDWLVPLFQEGPASYMGVIDLRGNVYWHH